MPVWKYKYAGVDWSRTNTAIAAELGVSQQAVSVERRLRLLPERHHRSHLLDWDAIFAAEEAGVSAAEIWSRFATAMTFPGFVAALKKRLGRPPKNRGKKPKAPDVSLDWPAIFAAEESGLNAVEIRARFAPRMTLRGFVRAFKKRLGRPPAEKKEKKPRRRHNWLGIERAYAAGESLAEISKKYGIGPAGIYRQAQKRAARGLWHTPMRRQTGRKSGKSQRLDWHAILAARGEGLPPKKIHARFAAAMSYHGFYHALKKREREPVPPPPGCEFCVVCGRPFPCVPSRKKITCSPACSLARKQNPAAVCRPAPAPVEYKTAPEHRSASKVWRVIAPDGQMHEVRNLKNWLRERLGREQGGRVAGGLRHAAAKMRGKAPRAGMHAYGWRLAGPPAGM
jgi:transposase